MKFIGGGREKHITPIPSEGFLVLLTMANSVGMSSGKKKELMLLCWL